MVTRERTLDIVNAVADVRHAARLIAEESTDSRIALVDALDGVANALEGLLASLGERKAE